MENYKNLTAEYLRKVADEYNENFVNPILQKILEVAKNGEYQIEFINGHEFKFEDNLITTLKNKGFQVKKMKKIDISTVDSVNIYDYDKLPANVEIIVISWDKNKISEKNTDYQKRIL